MTNDTQAARRGVRGRLRFLTVALLLFAGAALPAWGQEADRGSRDHAAQERRFSFGFVTGATLTPDYRTGYIGTTNGGTRAAVVRYRRPNFVRPLLGASAEMKLSRNLSLHPTVLFRALGSETEFIFPNCADCTGAEHPGFPFEGYYRKLANKSTDIWEIPVLVKYKFGTARVRPFVGAGPTFRIENNRKWLVQLREPHHGVAATLGFDVRCRRRWTVTSQINYTRWATDERPTTAKNQVQVLIGFSF